MICFNYKTIKVEDLSRSGIINSHIIDHDMMIGSMDVSWINAIVTDDFITVSSILNNNSEREKKRLLIGVIENADIENIPKAKTKHGNIHVFSASNPWSLAVSHSSRQVIELFLSYGVDVFQVDNEGNNALHKFVEFAFLNLEQEATLTDTYKFLRQCLGSDTIMKLLMMENTNRLRPLELTAHLGTLSLFQAILETDNVYMKKEEIYGVNKLQYFDVTEYEAFHPNTRRNHSPANLLMCLDNSTISERNRERTKQAFDSQPLCAWLDANFRANYFYIMIWVAIRVTSALLFYMIDFQAVVTLYGGNINISDIFNNQSQTVVSSCSGSHVSPKAHLYMMVLLTVMSLFMIIYDIWDLGRMIFIRRNDITYLNKTPRGSKSLILNIKFYRIVHFITCIGTFVMLIIVWISVWGGHVSVSTFVFFLVCFVAIGSVWSLFYFIQIIPSIGYFVISIQRMIIFLTQFTFIFFIFHLSFVYAFIKVLDMSILTGRCPMYFTSIGESFYGVFMIMLNMVNLHQYNDADVTSLFILHILYIFMVAILLITFLVAIFSSSYSEVAENKHVISRIQALSLAVVVENRIPEFMWPLSRWLQKRYFVVEGDKLYITRLVPLK